MREYSLCQGNPYGYALVSLKLIGNTLIFVNKNPDEKRKIPNLILTLYLIVIINELFLKNQLSLLNPQGHAIILGCGQLLPVVLVYILQFTCGVVGWQNACIETVSFSF